MTSRVAEQAPLVTLKYLITDNYYVNLFTLANDILRSNSFMRPGTVYFESLDKSH